MDTLSPARSARNAAPARRRPPAMALKVLVIVAVTAAVWFVPPVAGMDPRGMHMAAIFLGTILALILQPLPTASVAVVGLAVAMITGTMDASTEALQGFGNSAVWLIVAAFFIADGFLVTGLGRRVALWFVARLGRSSLGLSYGMAVTDLLLAPATPSNTARAGGVVFPIISSLAQVQGSTPETEQSRRRLGAYLAMTAVQVNTVTSAMFLTAMAGNPLAAEFAAQAGIEVSWGTWALAALVPGLLSLTAVPWVMAKIYPPTLKQTPEAPVQARQELSQLGAMSFHEKTMAGTFLLLLVLWCLGSVLDLNATAVAFVGISILLVTRVLSWKQMAANSGAWSTLLFFAVLVGMASHLNDLGVIDWVGASATALVGGMSWVVAFAVLALVYFYAHYFFASNTAQVVAMYAVFLGAAVGAGTPPLLAALAFGFIGNLFGGLAHYSSGPAGVVYGSGYVPTGEWFRVGFLMSVVNIVIWTVAGGLWTKLLGMW